MSLSAIAKEIGKAVSTINTIVKDRKLIKEATKGSTELGVMIISKKRQGPIAEMEKHLLRWMEDMLQKKTPLSLLIIQEKAISLYNDVKEKMGIQEGCFTASHGWFQCFKKHLKLEFGPFHLFYRLYYLQKEMLACMERRMGKSTKEKKLTIIR